VQAIRLRMVLVATVLALLGVTTFAQQPPSQTLTRTAQDAQLQWGPCPSFMPTGCALAVLRGDPAKPNADVFLKLPAKGVIPEHWHTSAERMVLVAGELHVSYTGQPKVVLTPGAYAYGPPKVAHRATCVGGAPCVLFIAFESAIDAFPTQPPAK